MAIPRDYLEAARRYGPTVDEIARRYVNPVTGKPLTGAALLLKLGKGESGFNAGATSSAGAHGRTQFMPGSRKVAIDKYGIDPWKDADSAVHAAALHLRGKINGTPGLEGYNPGGGRGYVNYILSQRVGASGAGGTTVRRRESPTRGGPSTEAAGTTADSTGQQLASLLLAQSVQGADQPRPQSVGLQTPAFAAGPSLPTGAMSVQSAGPRQESPGAALSRALSGAAALGTGVELPARDEPESGVRTPEASRGDGRKVRRSTPRAVIDFDVIPMAQELGIDVTPGTVAAANRRHGPTVNGGRSDHQGNGRDTWAGDFSNGSGPTKEMDALARRIAKKYGIPWKGSGAVTHTAGGYRFQLIYRSNVGGNHYNHVHFGVQRVRR